MKSKSCCNQWPAEGEIKVIRRTTFLSSIVLLCMALAPGAARAADAPQWMHALVNVPLPPHDERTDAVLLYYEEILNVQSNGKIKTIERRAYKILRPGGRERGTIYASYDSETRITGLRGWCIPALGKDYEVKDKDVLETSLSVLNGELASDSRLKILRIPAPDPG